MNDTGTDAVVPQKRARTSLDAAQLQGLQRLMAGSLQDNAPRALQAHLLSGGRSNLTYVVSDGTRDWILRRPPLGHVLETAHDMRREYRVMSALVGTPVPVPKTVVYCDDVSLLGAPFYVMERVPGTVFRSADDLRQVPSKEAHEIAAAFINCLALLHCVDVEEVGLGGFGRPMGYLDRQIYRWARQLEGSESRELKDLTAVGVELGRNTPKTSRVSIVHGDHRLDNAVVEMADKPRIAALLDWEMSTLGDPLADLALSWLYWEGWAGLDNPIAATPAEEPGWPPWPELAQRYVASTGLDLQRTHWYRAFALYKFAVICEGIHFRYVRGLTEGDGFETIGAMVPKLAARARDVLAKDVVAG